MANVFNLKNLEELNDQSWDTNLIITTVIYGNQDIHIKSVQSLEKITKHKIKITMIIVDNKGNYDVEKLIESANLKSRKDWDIYFYRRKKGSFLENDGAYNHSKAIHEIFNVLQKGRLITKYPNINPIVMLMDPDLFIIEKNYYEFITEKLKSNNIIGTRWTILKTHKFHSFPTPHLFITTLNTLKRLRVDYRSRPIARTITRNLFKIKFLHYLAMYNSFDPGCRMNNRYGVKILFLEQYYWKTQIEEVKKRQNKLNASINREKHLNMLPNKIEDETYFWIQKCYRTIFWLIKGLVQKKKDIRILFSEYIRNEAKRTINLKDSLKKRLSLMRVSTHYRELMLNNVDIRYFEDLDKFSIPEHFTSADIFHTDTSKIFAVHGHMNSKARRKEDFVDYVEKFR